MKRYDLVKWFHLVTLMCLVLGVLAGCTVKPIQTVPTVSIMPPAPVIAPLNLLPVQFSATGSVCMDASNTQNFMLDENKIDSHIHQLNAEVLFYQNYLAGLQSKK